MTDSTRIDDLRRRVDADPTSIAFAALAEEYRRAGQYEEAVEVCRNGLVRHPAYLSARVTLGRALMELGRLDEAQQELDRVLGTAPENLAAIRALSEIQARRGVSATGEPPAPPPPVAAPVSSSIPFELDLRPVTPVAPPEDVIRQLESTRQDADLALSDLQRLLDAIRELKAGA